MTVVLPPEVDEQLSPLVKAGQVVLIGEVHGTAQYPAIVATLAEAAVSAGLAVTVALEIPCSEVPGRFGSFWNRSSCDGRSSQAMAQLVDRVGEMRSNGSDVETVFIDQPYIEPGQAIPSEWTSMFSLPRDAVMAELLMEKTTSRPEAFTVALAGNVHTRVQAARARRHRHPQPFGSYVARSHHDAVSLKGKSSGGQAWILSGRAVTGQPRRIAPDRGLVPGADWTGEVDVEGHHGHVFVGPVTASLPYQPTET